MSLRRHPRELPAHLREIVAVTLPQWASLDGPERERLEHVAVGLLDHVTWEGSRGFALDDTVRATVAGHAALLALGLPDPVYPTVSAIVVHPATITLQGPRPGPIPGTVVREPLPVLGHTTAHGPVFIAWDVVARQAGRPERGGDVVLHEFAHKLDAEDGVLDGTPRLPDPGRRRRWIDVCEAEYAALRRGAGSRLLSDYAATSPSEFFAVATEVFFTRGAELAADRPELYEVLRDFYRQDPAARHPQPVA